MTLRNTVAASILSLALSVQSQGIGAAAKKDSKTGDQLRAKKCIEKGHRLDSIASQEGPDNERQYREALNAYLCAAKEGSAEGALLATSISLSGMAPRISDDSLRMLYQLAIDSNRLEGYTGMAELACGPEGFSNCSKDPKGAISWFRKGGWEPFQGEMRQILSNPGVLISDSAIAYGCLKLFRGKHVLQLRESMLKANPKLDTTHPCEPRP